MTCYLDTSALAKWYIFEAGSHAFASFVAEQAGLWISRLCMVELKCLLARRRRAGIIDNLYESRAFQRFLEQLSSGHLTMFVNSDEHLSGALRLIETSDAPLRTLDAIHLATADALGCTRLATGDHVMRAAAAQIGMEVVFFGPP